ncbi:MAG: hypothetical protein IT285_07990 [Bdellovibrionales bacterium]|nr:hypothetical protein [Bdellovibrionales bacterium]
MAKVLVVFGTTDGHTGKIAERMAATARARGDTVDLVRAKWVRPEQRPADYDLVVVAASIHAQGYQRAVKSWVRKHAEALSRRPSAFVSVCLGVLEKKPETDRALAGIRERFFSETGWRPGSVHMAAGALLYTRYSFLKKWVMKRIARKAGGGTDTRRDYEYTDWAALEAFTRKLSESLSPLAEDPRISRREAL